MPDYRKPPVERNSRADSATLDADSLDFSIETTTMRLKSLKLRRAEAADRALDEQLRGKPEAPPVERSAGGKVRHDERGMAVWDMAVATGEFAQLSATNILSKLDVGDLQIEETQRALKAAAPGREAGGDPYNLRKDSNRGDPYNPHARGGGDPYDKAAVGSDPYNQGGANQRSSPPLKRPVPAAASKKPGSVLDQLTGKKK